MSFFKKSLLPVLLSLAITASPVMGAEGWGDADFSGGLTSNDSAVILAYSLGNEAFTFDNEELVLLDVNKDGVVDSADAADVLIKSLNYDFKFKAETTTTESTTTTTESTTTTTETTTESTTTTEATTETTTTTVATTETTTTTVTTTTATTEATTEGTTTDPKLTFKTAAGSFWLGQAESSLPEAYSVGTTPTGLKCYSYSEDYSHYTRVGVSGGKVVNIITFDPDVLYEGYRIGDVLTSPNQKDEYTYAQNILSTRKVNADVYYDSYYYTKLDENGNPYENAEEPQDVRIYSISITIPGYIPTMTEFNDNTIAEMNTQITDMTNAFRTQMGLNALYWNDAVGSVAQEYAEDMANRGFFDHVSPEGGRLRDRIEAKNIRWSHISENIGAGYDDAESSMNGWINSFGHRQNLVESSFTHIGVGTSYNPEDPLMYYTRTVQNFLG